MRIRPPGVKAKPGTASGEVYPGAEVSADAVDFGRAMHAWQLRWRRRPTCADVLAVAHSLGHRQGPPPGE